MQSLETEEQTSDRRSRNLASKRKCITLETEEQTSDRRSRNLASKRKCITLETEEQTSDRRSRNLASKRKCIAQIILATLATKNFLNQLSTLYKQQIQI